MLVLSRKVDQQITIGDDITLTIVRVDGNRVRIGISAPRDKRILRGELSAQETGPAADEVEFELSEREFAFAHQNASDEIAKSKNRLRGQSEPQVFSGSVSTDGSKVNLKEATNRATRPAPLSGFVSAS
ncbi:MAG: carbon storage regulator [Planctomycetales bacterium]|nr:carbon storage regulator [Planctomycetales bacterium]